ncbi:MAG: tetratricopeptide repeat protein, partial [bacterium]
NEREEAEEILQLLVAGKAKKAIRVLKHEIELHPENPIYYNYLSNAYAMADDLSAANEVIVECYKKFPHYLFGRINYAQYLLDNNRIDEIPDVFDNQFELQAIYPERTEFHVYLVLKFT